MESRKLNIANSSEKSQQKNNDSITTEYPHEFRLPHIKCVAPNKPRVPPGDSRRRVTKPSFSIHNHPTGKTTSENTKKELWFPNRFERHTESHLGIAGNQVPVRLASNDEKGHLGLSKSDIKIPTGLAPIETKGRYRSEVEVVHQGTWAQRVAQGKKQITEDTPVGDPIDTWARRVIEGKKKVRTTSESVEIRSRELVEVKKGSHEAMIRPVIMPISSCSRWKHGVKAEPKISTVIPPIKNKIRATDSKNTLTGTQVWRHAEEKRFPPAYIPLGNRFSSTVKGMKDTKDNPELPPLEYGPSSGHAENRTIRIPPGISPKGNYPRAGLESLEGNMRLEDVKTVQVSSSINLPKKTGYSKFPAKKRV